MKLVSLQLTSLLTVLMFGMVFGAGYALAQALEVDFEATPLFLDANIEPGDSEARTVTVRNTTTEEQDVYVSVLNVFSTGLGEVMELTVTAPGSTYFTGVFDDFFSTTPLSLGTLAVGETKVFTFEAAFPSSAGNEYQTKQLGFDLVIGFVGGETVTDNPGGGNGGGGGSILRIFNEEVESVVGDTATLTWNTNLNASTYLVCGLVGDTPFTLTTIAPLFGYDFALGEFDTDTKTHTAVLTGLDTGTYECRPAGRVSPTKPFTVGEALRFTIAPGGQVAGAATTAPLISGLLSAPTGSVLGASGKGTFGGPTYDEWKAEMEAERAAALAAASTTDTTTLSDLDDASQNEAGKSGEAESGFTALTTWYWLLGLLLILVIFWYWRRVR